MEILPDRHRAQRLILMGSEESGSERAYIARVQPETVGPIKYPQQAYRSSVLALPAALVQQLDLPVDFRLENPARMLVTLSKNCKLNVCHHCSDHDCCCLVSHPSPECLEYEARSTLYLLSRKGTRWPAYKIAIFHN